MINVVRRCMNGSVACLALLVASRCSGEINIIPVFNNGANVAPINNQDATGANLTALFDYAAEYYEDIFEDTGHTLTINFWWEDLDPISTGRLGQHNLIGQTNPPSPPFPTNYCSQLITSPDPLCREDVANIRIDNDRNWFLDPTPADDSEFNMQQTFWRDLPAGSGAGSQGDLFNNFGGSSIPDTLEVGFGGTAVGGGPAAGTLDALSVILHEVGHALGMSFLNNSTIAETQDNDYDFNSDFIFGQTLAAEVADGNNIGHLDTNGFTMMGPNLPAGRVPPSHTDLFAMAAGHSYVTLDVPRREFYGGNDWHVDGNWSGNQIPAGADLAFVRHGGFVALSANAVVDGLVVDEQSQLATSTHRLTAFDSLTIQNTPGTGTTLLSVSTGGEVFADSISIQSNSRMFVAGLVDANDIFIAAGGEVTGDDGTIDVTNVLGDFVNNGRIAALFGGTLTIDSDNLLDLDGNTTGDGVLDAIGGDLVFNAPMTDAFNGTATVGPGRAISFNNGITIGSGGLLHADGEMLNEATVNGIVNIDPNGVLRGSGTSVVEAVLLLNGGIIEVPDGTAQLHINNVTEFAGGNISGAGTVHFNGFANVTDDTTISVATFDMDGTTGNSTISVLAGQTLRVESASLESGGDGYDGTLNINNGTVEIAAPWILEGTVNFNDTAAGSPELMGAGGVTVQGGTMNFAGGTGLVDTPVSVNNGTVFVDSDATMNGPTTLGANAMVEIDGGDDSLRLRGQTTLISPSIVGAGRLILEDSVSVAFADTTIGVAETDLDGIGNTEITINNGLSLSIVSSTIEPTANDGFDGTIHNHGTFSVLAGWRLDGTLNMDRAAGPSSLNGGPLEGIFSSAVVEARHEAVINPDTTVAGTISVIGGHTQLNGSATFLSSAVVDITTNGELELNGPTEFNGGSYQGQGTFQWDGAVNVADDTDMTLGVVDIDGTIGTTVTTLGQSRLTLNVDQIDAGVNRFDGTMHMSGVNAGLAVNLNDPTASWQMDGAVNANGAFGLLRQHSLQGSPIMMTGTINADANVEFSAPLDVSGTISLNDTGTEAWLSQSTHVIRNTATVTGPGQVVVADDGTVLAEDGSTIDAEVFSFGRFEPGTSTGTAAINDDYTQLASGILGIEIAGAPGVNQDLLQVSGAANLAGELEVSVIDGAMPSIGPVYTLLTAAPVVGTFDTFTLQSDTIFQYEATLGYPGSRVTLRFTDVAMFGDFNDDLVLDCIDIDALVAEIAGSGMGAQFDLNGDSMVDISDLNLWLEEAGTFNVGGPYLPGDANLDGFVDGSDFNTWNANKFTTDNGWCGADFNADGGTDGSDFNIWNGNKFQSSTSMATVPEPAALGSIVLGTAMALIHLRILRKVP